MRPKEKEEVYLMGYVQWGNGRTWEAYEEENREEEVNGVRYVLVDEDENVLSSLLVEHFRRNLIGIGSLVTPKKHRGHHFGKRLIAEVVELLLNENQNRRIFLYSDIGEEYYESVGFRKVSQKYQLEQEKILMVYKNQDEQDEVKMYPGYF